MIGVNKAGRVGSVEHADDPVVRSTSYTPLTRAHAAMRYVAPSLLGLYIVDDP
jgi:hypothetical protein